MKRTLAALIFGLIFIFSTCSPAWAIPIESVPDADAHRGDPVAAATSASPPPVKLPDSPVHMYIRDGTESRFELFFIDARYGHDVVDFESYKAWCLLKNKPIRRNAMHKVMLYSSYDPNLPPELKGTGWNQINYIINHKQGSKADIQQAIRHFTNGSKPAKYSAEATRLIEEANLKGKDYIPGEGELMAIVLVPASQKQPVFIEYMVPEAVTFDAAPTVFAPAIAAAAGPAPASLALVPLAFLPALFDHGGGPHLPPPPAPPAVPEPSVAPLAAIGLACLLAAWPLRKRLRKN